MVQGQKGAQKLFVQKLARSPPFVLAVLFYILNDPPPPRLLGSFSGQPRKTRAHFFLCLQIPKTVLYYPADTCTRPPTGQTGFSRTLLSGQVSTCQPKTT